MWFFDQNVFGASGCCVPAAFIHDSIAVLKLKGGGWFAWQGPSKIHDRLSDARNESSAELEHDLRSAFSRNGQMLSNLLQCCAVVFCVTGLPPHA